MVVQRSAVISRMHDRDAACAEFDCRIDHPIGRYWRDTPPCCDGSRTGIKIRRLLPETISTPIFTAVASISGAPLSRNNGTLPGTVEIPTFTSPKVSVSPVKSSGGLVDFGASQQHGGNRRIPKSRAGTASDAWLRARTRVGGSRPWSFLFRNIRSARSVPFCHHGRVEFRGRPTLSAGTVCGIDARSPDPVKVAPVWQGRCCAAPVRARKLGECDDVCD